MIGKLPTSIEVGGKNEPIRTDYRDILNIFSAFNDEELSGEEKILVCLRILYENIEEMDVSLYEEAYNKAVIFMNQGRESKNDNAPTLMDWEQDENLIFPAVNNVAGMEVRACEYMHWWTFVGYYMGIGESVFSEVINIRSKKQKGKKLEKYEKEFYNKNRELVDLKVHCSKEEIREKEELKKLLGI